MRYQIKGAPNRVGGQRRLSLGLPPLKIPLNFSETSNSRRGNIEPDDEKFPLNHATTKQSEPRGSQSGRVHMSSDASFASLQNFRSKEKEFAQAGCTFAHPFRWIGENDGEPQTPQVLSNALSLIAVETKRCQSNGLHGQYGLEWSFRLDTSIQSIIKQQLMSIGHESKSAEAERE
jgi:hypothetical protein